MEITRTDVISVVVKGSLGAIPVVGTLAAEVVGVLIPNQRLDRIEALLAEVSKQIGESEGDDLRARFTSPEFVDVLEEGFQQASRALPGDRIQLIAAILKNGLTEAEFDHLQDKRLLELLGEVNDAEIVLLRSHTLASREGDWKERHSDILIPPVATMNSSQQTKDKATIHGQFNANLARLGLLRARFRSWKKGEVPKFDATTGLPQVSGYELTPLGRLLLRRVDVLKEGEW